MIRIPQSRKWSIKNTGDVFGDLYSAYNINFDEEGYLTINPKAVSIYSQNDDADFDLPLSIVPYDSTYFILTNDEAFILSSNLTFTQVAGTPSVSVNSDAVAWQNRVYVTSDNDTTYYDGSWTTSLQSTTSGNPHPMAVMENFPGGYLAIANGNVVYLIDTSHNLVATLTINEDQEIHTLKYYQNNLYIGTKALTGQTGKVFVWNGSGTAAQSSYGVGANWVFALEEYQSSIVAVTSKGEIRIFTGSGFKILAVFPVALTNYRWTSSAVRVQRRGIAVDGDLLYINIQGAVTKFDDFFYLANQPSGLWCYDQKVGLYCRSLSTTDALGLHSVSSVSSSVLTLGSSIKAVTGEPVYVTSVGSISGITANTTYYAIVLTDTTIKLSSSQADAANGVFITLTGTSGGAAIKTIGYLNYGQRHGTGDVGAIGLINDDASSPRIFPEIVRSKLLWGFSDTGDLAYLNCFSTGSNIGGFTTVKVSSNQVTDTYQKGYIKYSGIDLDHEKILVKTRCVEKLGIPTVLADGTYATTTSIASTSDDLEQVENKFNINLVKGNGSGQSVQLTTRSGEVFNLKETMNVTAGDAIKFNIDNYNLVKTVSDNKLYSEFPLAGDKASKSWIQLMVELQGYHIKVEEVQIVNSNYKPST